MNAQKQKEALEKIEAGCRCSAQFEVGILTQSRGSQLHLTRLFIGWLSWQEAESTAGMGA